MGLSPARRYHKILLYLLFSWIRHLSKEHFEAFSRLGFGSKRIRKSGTSVTLNQLGTKDRSTLDTLTKVGQKPKAKSRRHKTQDTRPEQEEKTRGGGGRWQMSNARMSVCMYVDGCCQWLPNETHKSTPTASNFSRTRVVIKISCTQSTGMPKNNLKQSNNN